MLTAEFKIFRVSFKVQLLPARMRFCEKINDQRRVMVAYPHSAVEGRAGLNPLPDSRSPFIDRSASHLLE